MLGTARALFVLAGDPTLRLGDPECLLVRIAHFEDLPKASPTVQNRRSKNKRHEDHGMSPLFGWQFESVQEMCCMGAQAPEDLTLVYQSWAGVREVISLSGRDV